MKKRSRTSSGRFFLLLALFAIAVRCFFLVRDSLNETHGDPAQALIVSLSFLAAFVGVVGLIGGGLLIWARAMLVLRDDVLAEAPGAVVFTVQATDEVSRGLKPLYPELFTGPLRERIGLNFVVAREDAGISFWKRVGPVATRRLLVPWTSIQSIEPGTATLNAFIQNRPVLVITVIGEKSEVPLRLFLRDCDKLWYPFAPAEQLDAAVARLVEKGRVE